MVIVSRQSFLEFQIFRILPRPLMTKTYGPPFVITKSWIILNFELDSEKGRWQFSYTTLLISNKFLGAKKKKSINQ